MGNFVNHETTAQIRLGRPTVSVTRAAAIKFLCG
ncbi:MAG: hypothetical protein HW378_4447, partial [Anaerolineales bacterium]|nr:hypothetical protein [Anaerolineales bacterium]